MKKKASVLHLTETGSGQEASDSWRRALGLTGGLVDDPQRTGRVSECPCVCETRGDNPEQDLLRRGSWRDRAKGQVTHTHAHTHTHTHTQKTESNWYSRFFLPPHWTVTHMINYV